MQTLVECQHRARDSDFPAGTGTVVLVDDSSDTQCQPVNILISESDHNLDEELLQVKSTKSEALGHRSPHCSSIYFTKNKSMALSEFESRIMQGSQAQQISTRAASGKKKLLNKPRHDPLLFPK